MSRAYPARPLIGLGVLVLRQDAVLLVRRGRPPAKGSWSIPGGAQKLGETVEEGARRELREETGLAVGALCWLTHVDSIHLDPSGSIEYHYTILDFAARWTTGEPVAGSDVTAAGFFPPDALAGLNLSGATCDVIQLARTRLRAG